MKSFITAAQADRFRDLVAKHLGLYFDDGKQESLTESLQARLLLHGARSADRYLDELGAAGTDECRALAASLTVGETYFFRNPDHYRALRELVLPDLLSRSGGRRLRILSAGCSSGEEAYTIAMILREQLQDRAAYEVVGIDLNPAAIERARAGVYSAWSLRQTSPEIQSRYFVPQGREYRLQDKARGFVSFEERNLIHDDPRFWQPDSFDVVFCRNVTMYFAATTTREVMARITSSLVPGGYLFLGHAETLRGLSDDHHLRHTHDTFYYQRKEPGPARTSAGECGPRGPGDAVVAAELAAADVAYADSWVEAIQRASERIAALARRGSDAEASAPAPATVDLAEALELMRHERFADAIALVARLPSSLTEDPGAQLLHAVLLTNTGDRDEAERICARLLELDELNAGAHYLMALCREHAGDVRGAVDHDQSAAYLDPGFVMPRLHLGLLARRAGDLTTARRELSRAVTLLPREDPVRLLFFGGGFSREALLELCRAELKNSGGPP